MFSPLARGSANWDGGIQLEDQDDDIVSYESKSLSKSTFAKESFLNFDNMYILGRRWYFLFPMFL